jgi:hypothetical protein
MAWATGAAQRGSQTIRAAELSGSRSSATSWRSSSLSMPPGLAVDVLEAELEHVADGPPVASTLPPAGHPGITPSG